MRRPVPSWTRSSLQPSLRSPCACLSEPSGSATGQDLARLGRLRRARSWPPACGCFSILLRRAAPAQGRRGELVAQATFLDSLVESMGTIAQTREAAEILERTRREAERIFRARAQMLPPGEKPQAAPAERSVLFPLRVHGEEIASLRLTRNRGVSTAATSCARRCSPDFAARAAENARLLAEAKVREADRARLSEQLVTAEQDERRRLALFLHDGPVSRCPGSV